MRQFFLLALTLSLLGCATGKNPQDPYESMNRKVYTFNDTLDKAIVKPVAKGYVAALPSPARTGIRNFFDNLSSVWSLANNILQLRPVPVMNDLMRVSVNTVLGLGGLIDIATPMGLAKSDVGVGDTLAYYGYYNSSYFVIPFIGPSTVRDTIGFAGDALGSPAWNIFSEPIQTNSAIATNLIDKRSRLLPYDSALDAAAIDPYSFVRDTYLQIRAKRLRTHEGLPGSRTQDDNELSIDDLVPPDPAAQ